jgi:hypothetical protein
MVVLPIVCLHREMREAAPPNARRATSSREKRGFTMTDVATFELSGFKGPVLRPDDDA